MSFMFENLEVYQKSVDLAEEIINLTDEFPKGYYFLTDQLNRASLSVSSICASVKSSLINAAVLLRLLKDANTLLLSFGFIGFQGLYSDTQGWYGLHCIFAAFGYRSPYSNDPVSC